MYVFSGDSMMEIHKYNIKNYEDYVFKRIGKGIDDEMNQNHINELNESKSKFLKDNFYWGVRIFDAIS